MTKHKNDYADEKLLEHLKPVAIIGLVDGLIKAKTFANLFIDQMEGVKLSRDIVLQYSELFPKCLSICFNYDDAKTYNKIIILKHDVNRNGNRYLRSCVEKTLQLFGDHAFGKHQLVKMYSQQLNATLESLGTEPRNIRTLQRALYHMYMQTWGRFDTDLDDYMTIHRSFTEDKLVAMEAMIRALVDSSYKNVELIDYDTLLLPNSMTENTEKELARSYIISKGDEFSTLQSLKVEIEKKALESFGFPRGTFLYSKPYYDLLRNLKVSPLQGSTKQEL